MDTTFKIILGIATALGAYKMLRIGGDQKAAQQDRAHARARKDVADAKALKRTLADRR